MNPNRPLPEHLVQPLSPEFSLVTIQHASDWAEVRRRLGLPETASRFDPRQGPIIGIQARVGENAAGRWPLRMVSIDRVEHHGHLQVEFLAGVYFPISTAGYLELAQVCGPANIAGVRINDRLFLLRAAGPAN